MAGRARIREAALAWKGVAPRGVFEQLRRRDRQTHGELVELLRDWGQGDRELREAIPGVNELTRFANHVLGRFGLRISRASLTEAVLRHADTSRRSDRPKPGDANSAS